MKLRVAVLVCIIATLVMTARTEAQTVRLYLVPSEVYDPGTGTVYYGPLYFQWRFGSGDLPRIGQVDYGFADGFLVLAELDAAQEASLLAHTEVVAFPVGDGLDANIAQADTAALRDAFETFNVPTDWLTAANTYRELLRTTYGIFRFAQRYTAIAAENGAPPRTFLFDAVGLDTQYRNFPAEVQAWFSLTVADYGIDPAVVKNNATIRQMLKQAGDYLAIPLEIGGYTF